MQDVEFAKCQVCKSDMTLSKVLISERFSNRTDGEKTALLKENGYVHFNHALSYAALAAIVLLATSAFLVIAFFLRNIITRAIPDVLLWVIVGVLVAGVVAFLVVYWFADTSQRITSLIKQCKFEAAFEIALKKVAEGSGDKFLPQFEIPLICLGYYLNKDLDYLGKIDKLNKLYEEKNNLDACHDLVKEIANDISVEYCSSYYM
jgi:hypothetical protein